MRTAYALLEFQRRFLDAVYGVETGEGLAGDIAGNGLEPSTRVRIYRHSSEQIHATALRTSYPAVLTLVGEIFFEHAAVRYRRAHPSGSGNLHVFGARFGEVLETFPELRKHPYVPDVARLEWRRQLAALADDAGSLPPQGFGSAAPESHGQSCIIVHPSVQTVASPFPILAILRHAMQPAPGRLTLTEAGEQVVVWRSSDGQVSMAALDAASFACIDALLQRRTLEDAVAAACVRDSNFEPDACLASFAANGIITTPATRSSLENAPCSNG